MNIKEFLIFLILKSSWSPPLPSTCDGQDELGARARFNIGRREFRRDVT